MTNEHDDVLAAWHSQPVETMPPDLKEIRQMETRLRRNTYDLYAAVTLSAAVILAIAFLFPHPLLATGAVLLACGLGYLAYEVRRHRRGVPTAASPSLDYHRALLEQRLAFHRTRVWVRVAALAPGGIAFFLGFAAAQPRLAPMIYVQLATFAIALAAIIPANRRAARKVQRQIEELDRLRAANR